MKKIINTSIPISLFIIFLLCSCIHLPDTDISDLGVYTVSSDDNDSKTASAESSGNSSENSYTASYPSNESYAIPSLQQSKPVAPSDSSDSGPPVSSRPEISDQSSAESSGTAKGTQLLYDLYESAYQKNLAMKSYDITTTEQYSCPSAGLDESVAFTNIYDEKTDCFSYDYYDRLYGKPSFIEAYGDETGSVYINNDGDIFVGNRNSIKIDMPPLCDFNVNDISVAKMGFSLNRTVLYFTIDSTEIVNRLVNLWTPVVGKGLDNFSVKVNSVEVAAIIDKDGYLVSKTCKIQLTATDTNENIEPSILSAEQKVEYSPPSDCKSPTLFDFAAQLMNQDNANTSDI